VDEEASGDVSASSGMTSPTGASLRVRIPAPTPSRPPSTDSENPGARSVPSPALVSPSRHASTRMTALAMIKAAIERRMRRSSSST
jgi:hypothetical protein